MNLLLNPESELFSILLNDTDTPYIFRLFIDLTKVIEYRGGPVRIKNSPETIYLEPLDALVPDFKVLGITAKQRRTGVDKLASLGIIEKKPSFKLPNSKRYSPLVIRFNINCELMQFKFSLGNFVSKYAGEEVEINGVKFVAPEWLNVEEFREDLSNWVEHVRSRVPWNRAVFEEDIHENLKPLFNYLKQNTTKDNVNHKIYYPDNDKNVINLTFIKLLTEKGITSFGRALDRKESLLNTSNNAPKKEKKAVKSSPWLKVHNALKFTHDVKLKTVDIEEEFNTLNNGVPVDFDKLVSLIENIPPCNRLTLKRVHKLYSPKTAKPVAKKEQQKEELTEEQKAEKESFSKMLESLRNRMPDGVKVTY